MMHDRDLFCLAKLWTVHQSGPILYGPAGSGEIIDIEKNSIKLEVFRIIFIIYTTFCAFPQR